ncbi:MAG TPA: serine O-acetyltransferase, partial [Candidatus Melainabacteria bacterium]|nr:serine O-acetyltransferase [Candidatus Melainabacteria bacterium]
MFSDYLEEIITTIMELDPAARSRFEVILCYPGFHALVFHRFSNKLWKSKRLTLARFVSHLGRMLTGIEIHPGATLGRRFVIDHGMGVVIGETAVVGDDCFIYQGVTLGAGPEAREGEKPRGVTRHPPLGNGVVVGSGAVIQGDILIEDNARVASGSIVLKNVPA